MLLHDAATYAVHRALIARDDSSHYELYRYKPSLPAAIVFTILFALVTSLHGYQMIRTRTWFYIPFFIGGLCEVIGYIFRAINASEAFEAWSLTPFILQSVLPLVAPALFAASIYMELARIVEVVKGDALLFIRRQWLTRIFVTGDVISFFMQGGGGGLMGSKMINTINIGQKVIVGGLFVQITFFGIFVLAATIFHYRLLRNPTQRSHEVPWTKHMVAMYVVSVLIMIRSIFRVAEFLQGNDGYLMHHEFFIYIFDAALMLCVMLCMNWAHPSEIRAYLKGGQWATGFSVKEAPEEANYSSNEMEDSHRAV
ncbi:RTA1-domain-containing protein [Microthyrium microscopicum]|uniref:RTA1-domain-containing protein n=1 Tax=Microthyrium microscopicum TaxID=703497 RepID=A0A6A6U2F6_9PEZI|nr:RTA1-domain-containing protein [Microthyrium microscopicum]